MTKQLITIVIVALNTVTNAQTIAIDTIDFYDTLKFKRTIVSRVDNRIKYVQYDEIGGDIRKIEYYDSKRRIERDKVWKDTLIRETKYTYYDNNQVIKRYDVTNNRALPTELNINFNYPVLARENEIEGMVEVKLDYNSDCVPVFFKVLDSLGHGIDEEVNKKMKIMIGLAKKYSITFNNCTESNDNFKINFKLK